MMAGLLIREAQKNDCKRLHAIINEAYRGEKCWTNESKLVKNERISVDGILEIIDHGKDPLLIAEKEGNVVGCIQAELGKYNPDMKLPPNSALIGLFAVDPNVQSSGIGSSLMKAILKKAREYGCSLAVIWVLQQRTELIQWYQRCGFELTEEKRDFVAPDNLLQDDTFFRVMLKQLND